MKQQLIAVLGPTASGKSAVAMALAERHGGEIVSCDSMQVYRGMDIGTAKPSADEQARVPHNLIDIRDIAEPWNLQQFLTLADQAVREILARGRLPILCGGTGLYAKALLSGFDLRPTDKALRESLQAQITIGERDALVAELAAADAAVAAQLGENDRYLVRAVEVLRLTGRAPRAEDEPTAPDYVGPQIVLLPDADTSRARITARCHAMLDAGWIDETARLIEAGLLDTPTAAQALGYREISDFLVGHIPSRDALIAELVTRTARFAKRQRTWFRNQHPSAQLVPVPPQATLNTLIDAAAAHCGLGDRG